MRGVMAGDGLATAAMGTVISDSYSYSVNAEGDGAIDSDINTLIVTVTLSSAKSLAKSRAQIIVPLAVFA